MGKNFFKSFLGIRVFPYLASSFEFRMENFFFQYSLFLFFIKTAYDLIWE